MFLFFEVAILTFRIIGTYLLHLKSLFSQLFPHRHILSLCFVDRTLFIWTGLKESGVIFFLENAEAFPPIKPSPTNFSPLQFSIVRLLYNLLT